MPRPPDSPDPWYGTGNPYCAGLADGSGFAQSAGIFSPMPGLRTAGKRRRTLKGGSQIMTVRAILEAKGSQVATVPADATIRVALDKLKIGNYGALVVSDDGETVQGIISERDIVRAMADHGNDLLTTPVARLMTRQVHTCRLSDKVKELMGVMTRHRIRHVPVVEDGRLCGLISIGDVVKTRVDELETETSVLRDYIGGKA
jgi:CBS domain-containing protein